MSSFCNCKELAKDAAHGSLEEIKLLYDWMQGIRRNQGRLVLPAFHASLEAFDIATILDQLESLASSKDIVRRLVAQNLLSLRAILDLIMNQCVDKAALVSLWPPIWSAPGSGSFYEPSTYGDYVALLGYLIKTSSLMHTSPGVHVVVARAWSRLVQAGSDRDFGDLCEALTGLLCSPDAVKLEELVDGGGGTRADLASLAVLHIGRVLPSPDSAVTLETFTYLGYALLSQNLVRALKIAVLALSNGNLRSSVDAFDTLARAFSVLVKFLTRFPGHTWMTEALGAGLLRAVFSCSSSKNIARTREGLEYIFRYMLPASMVYYSVLSQLRNSVDEIHHLDAKATFGASGIFEQWVLFQELAGERLRIGEDYNRGDFACLRACDDLTCGAILSKQEFERCAGYSVSYYYSKSCQTSDWRHGGHRDACAALLSGRLADWHLSARDKSFMRALLYHHYRTMETEILINHLPFMAIKPTEVPPCTISIGSHEELKDAFLDHVARAAQAGGRIQLHMIQHGGDPGVAGIADGIPSHPKKEALEPYHGKVQDSMDLDVVEMH
ncbi:hypothetical protein DFH09DRAFT_1375711 [Mycena vulgaris]|nr:hypothetical protein DFH09DRAFT_1375711 [Mycena vulgaris]